MDTPPAYHVVRLPNREWREQGEEVILPDRITKTLVRCGQYRLVYMARDRPRFGCYGLITLVGPPGTGKTVIARWAADQAVRGLGRDATGNALLVNTPGLFSEHLGQSQKLVARLFADIALSGQRVPTTVIFDDADSLFLSRQQSVKSDDPTDCLRVTTELLAGLDRLRTVTNVLMFATCNLDGVLDPAIVSRSDLILRFALPDTAARLAILAPQLQARAGSRVLHALAAATEGMSGRELARANFLAYVTGTAETPEKLTEADYLAAFRMSPGNGHRNGAHHAPTAEKEEDSCTSSLNNGSPVAATPRRRRSLFHWP